MELELYKKMYAIVCAAASDALDLLPATPDCAPAAARLRQALRQAEELYVSQEEV